MPDTPDNLNERAAKAMGWDRCQKHRLNWPANDDAYIDRSGRAIRMAGGWSPASDYNHARLLYERVVEVGLEETLQDWLYRTALSSQLYPCDFIGATLRLAPAQLALACCEVLEEHQRKATP